MKVNHPILGSLSFFCLFHTTLYRFTSLAILSSTSQVYGNNTKFYLCSLFLIPYSLLQRELIYSRLLISSLGFQLSLVNVTPEFLALYLSPEPHIFFRTLPLRCITLTQSCHLHLLWSELGPSPKIHMLKF